MTQQPNLVPQSDSSFDDRPSYAAPPAVLGRLSISQTPWSETPDEIEAGLEYGRKNAQLLEWVRSQMRLRLSRVERRCIELYYFDGLNYRESAEALGVNVTSVYRGVKRALLKLRKAARDYPPAGAPPKKKRRTRAKRSH